MSVNNDGGTPLEHPPLSFARKYLSLDSTITLVLVLTSTLGDPEVARGITEFSECEATSSELDSPNNIVLTSSLWS